MTVWILTSSVVLSLVDAIVTRHRLRWELNPLVRRLALLTSPTLSVVLGVFLVQVLWGIGLFLFAPSVLLVFLGLQLHRTWWQYQSLKPLSDLKSQIPVGDAGTLPSTRQNIINAVPPPASSNPIGPLQQGSSAVDRKHSWLVDGAALQPLRHKTLLAS